MRVTRIRQHATSTWAWSGGGHCPPGLTISGRARPHRNSGGGRPGLAQAAGRV